MKKKIFLFLLSLMIVFSFAQEKRIKFVIETPFGQMKGELYNETQLHRDNFVKLVKEDWYNDSPFHRVIKDFMIQGGQNKDGRQDPGYKIPAEIMPKKYIHKKGALAAARQSDQVNPQKESSGSQFYIVQGKITDDGLLDNFQSRITQQLQVPKIKKFVNRPENRDLLDKLIGLQKARKNKELDELTQQIILLMEAEGINMEAFTYTEKQRAVYRTIGGSPHLDGAYTVFGEITEGFDVIDKIAAVPIQGANIPIDEITMKIRIVK